MGKLGVLSGKAVCAVLSKQGFLEVRRRGSHIVMQKKLSKVTITVPVPDHDEIRIGTLRSIIRQSGLHRSEFEQILMLGSASGVVHSEIMPVHRTSFEELDQARLENYLRDILKDPEVPETRAAWISRLKALGLMVDGVTEEPVCTIVGLVLFGIKPRQFLKQSGVRLIFFDALDKIYQARMDKVLDAPIVGRFQVGKTGKSLIDGGLIEKSLELMEPFITLEPNEIDQNFRRERKWLYPFEAIRELLINALAHRDWTRFVDVEISGYLDRLEITSPGALPNSMTVEKMLAGQRSARNTIVVEVLRDYGYVDARGMGVRTKVVPALKAEDAEYDFEATEDFVRVRVGKASLKDDLYRQKCSVPDGKEPVKQIKIVGKARDRILEAIRGNAGITIPELAKHADLTPRSVERNLRKLQEEGALRRVGGRKLGRWEVIS